MIQAAYITRRPRKVWELTIYHICRATGARLADGGPMLFSNKAEARAWALANGCTPWNF